MTTPPKPTHPHPRLRPQGTVEVAIVQICCFVEDLDLLKKRAGDVLAALQTIRREQQEQKP